MELLAEVRRAVSVKSVNLVEKKKPNNNKKGRRIYRQLSPSPVVTVGPTVMLQN